MKTSDDHDVLDEELQHLNEILNVNHGSKSRNQWYTSGPAQLLDHLYLGDYSDADSLGMLKELGITHILNCAGCSSNVNQSRHKFLNGGNTGIKAYHQFDADDRLTYQMSQHFKEAIDFIESAREKGGKVLVYCAKGMNRSAAVCVAYVMTYKRQGLFETAREVQRQRGRILTNKGFQEQLVIYAKQLGCYL